MSPPENKEEGLKRGLSAHRKGKGGSCLGMSCSTLATRPAFHACFCAAFPQAVAVTKFEPYLLSIAALPLACVIASCLRHRSGELNPGTSCITIAASKRHPDAVMEKTSGSIEDSNLGNTVLVCSIADPIRETKLGPTATSETLNSILAFCDWMT
jgi:hypothetical protein